jgi:excisionase family DNA binding protein
MKRKVRCDSAVRKIPKTGARLLQILRIIRDPVMKEEAAVLLKVSVARVRQFIASKMLPAERWGLDYILSRKAVIEFSKRPRKRGRPRKRRVEERPGAVRKQRRSK